MELKTYNDFRENDTIDKFLIIDSREYGLDGILSSIDKIVWVVFPKPNKIYPMEITLDPMLLKLSISTISIENMNNFKLNNNDLIGWNNSFDRSMKFDENGNYHIECVDKIKIFSTYADAKKFIECKSDKDFVKRDGNYYVFSVREAQNVIAKALNINNPRLVVIETN